MADPSATFPAPTVTVGDVSVTLQEPSLLFTMTGYKRPADGAPDTAAVLAYQAAALRMCWPDNVTWPAKPRPREWFPGQDVLRYGGEVYDGIRRATRGKVSIFALHEAMREAEAWAVRSGMTEAEVQEASRFLGEAEGSTAESSESAESTDSPPDGGTV